jgi:hypothetical protein
MVLAARLASLEMLCAAPASGGPRSPRVPPILLVTASAERVPRGYRPGLLWTTGADVMTKGVIDAPWRSSDLGAEALPLPAALAAQGVGPTWDPIGVPLSRGETPVLPHTRGQRQRLQERIDALHEGGTQDGELSLLALAIPPRGMAILETVGGHPLLPATDIARVCDLNPVDAWDLLGRLCRHGLAAAWTPPKRRTRRYVLTARGLRLLAARAGLAPDTYRRIYGALDETAGRARRGLRFAQRNLAHTDGINSVYLALLAAARAAGGALQWRGEWACTQIYANGPRLHTLRPDAEGRYCGPVGPLHFFVEVDRGTARLWRLATKLAQYYAYRSHSERDEIVLLLVTTGPDRGRAATRLNEALAARTRTPVLDLRVTTQAELAQLGSSAHPRSAVFGARGLLHPSTGRTIMTQVRTAQSCEGDGS